ncbi:MAG: histidine--tRNA ligase [bacterium]|nr:histidine--tRNA ligase [bacterium]
MSPKKKKVEELNKDSESEGKERYQTVRGMHDILPREEAYWKTIREIGYEISELHDFSFIETPILEPAGLFEEGIGEATDIVEKEMFSFKTRGGEVVVLRPEGTAPVMRSYIQNHLGHFASPLRVFYEGPMFRYERPQAGRYRQFHQWGFEIIGDGDPFYDVQIILVTINFLTALGIKGLKLKINTVGCRVCRPTYRKRLLQYYKTEKRGMCKDCIRRYDKNPLRLLDCKEKECEEIRKGAPIILDNLCQNCNAHFKETLELVESNNIDYEPNPHLVRGLDYYSRTVFEIASEGNPKLALAGGGRYDYLGEILGGRMIPAVGVSLGLERIIEYMKKENIAPRKRERKNVFFVAVGDEAKKRSLRLINTMRLASIRVLESVGKQSIKNQLRSADKTKSKLALILGQRECFEDSIILRNMESGEQETIPIEKMIEEIKKRLR